MLCTGMSCLQIFGGAQHVVQQPLPISRPHLEHSVRLVLGFRVYVSVSGVEEYTSGVLGAGVTDLV